MVQVYLTEVTNLPDPKVNPNLMEGLSEERKEKISRYTRLDVRRQSLGAGLLLRHVLNSYGKSCKDVTYGSNGKPKVEGICFNLSHSGDMAVCAVSTQPVGCDIEKVGKAQSKMAERFFCEREVAYLNTCPENERDDAFYRLWTMKESYIKMTGEGMRLSLDRFEFIMEEPVRVLRDGTPCNCFVKEYEVPGYKLTVCAEEFEFAQEVKYISFL